MCECEFEHFCPRGRGSPLPFHKSKGREWIKRERERDPRDRAASRPFRMGPTSPVDDDGGAPMLCPSAMCGRHPNGTGSAGLPSRRTGDMRPTETGGVSPQHVLQLDPERGG
jgi:hypothetical protein